MGVAGSNPARFNFVIHTFFLGFKSEGWWLFNKKLQIIVISLPQCVEQVPKLVKWCNNVQEGPDSNPG